MQQWVKLCTSGEAPQPGQATECTVADTEVCLANLNGELFAVGNICPHRQGPLGQGWIEGESIVCPWHAWGFNLHTGIADPPEKGSVASYPLRREGDDILIQINEPAG